MSKLNVGMNRPVKGPQKLALRGYLYAKDANGQVIIGADNFPVKEKEFTLWKNTDFRPDSDNWKEKNEFNLSIGEPWVPKEKPAAQPKVEAPVPSTEFAPSLDEEDLPF